MAPLSDGGPGFIDVLRTSLGGNVTPLVVTGPVGEPVPVEVLLVNETAYVESAQSCGLHLVPIDAATQRRDPTVTSSIGLGQTIDAAISLGARRIVIGIGGTGTNDAGAGVLAALGGEPAQVLSRGGLSLSRISNVDLDVVLRRVDGVDLVVATDVDVPLLGLRGASNGFGPQKGATEEQVMALEGALEHFAGRLGKRADGRDPAVALGAGAGGGIGFALLRIGGRRVAGMETVRQAIDLEARIAAADLVVTGEGTFDWSSLRGKAVSAVASMAMAHARPVIVVAGQVRVGRREFGAIGVESAYSLSDHAGSVEEALARAEHHLSDLARRVAATWSR
jgi:glycerate 2-kinase